MLNELCVKFYEKAAKILLLIFTFSKSESRSNYLALCKFTKSQFSALIVVDSKPRAAMNFSHVLLVERATQSSS